MFGLSAQKYLLMMGNICASISVQCIHAFVEEINY